MPIKRVTCLQMDNGRCNLCGGIFGEGESVCSGGMHEIGQSYPMNVPDAAIEPKATEQSSRAVCIPIENRCSICKEPFGSDETCRNGHHVGQWYDMK